jgi:hypothetical protein
MHPFVFSSRKKKKVRYMVSRSPEKRQPEKKRMLFLHLVFFKKKKSHSRSCGSPAVREREGALRLFFFLHDRSRCGDPKEEDRIELPRRKKKFRSVTKGKTKPPQRSSRKTKLFFSECDQKETKEPRIP